MSIYISSFFKIFIIFGCTESCELSLTACELSLTACELSLVAVSGGYSSL